MKKIHTLYLTHAEAAALSCAAVWADGAHKHPALQSARLKLRAALNGKPLPTAEEAERFVRTEC